MILVDSSGWIEYFTLGPNCRVFAPAIEDTENLLVPTICIYEVFKHVLRKRGKRGANRAVGGMVKGHVVGLPATTAMGAARLSLRLRLPMADSLILSTARRFGAEIWTQDEDFRGIEGVRYIQKR
jgi:predicted nucleic acid-binding protein